MGLRKVLLFCGGRLILIGPVALKIDVSLLLSEHRLGLHLRLYFVSQVNV